MKLHPSLHLDLHCSYCKGQGPSFRASDEDITPERTFIVTKDANIGIGTNVPAANQRLDVRGNVTTQGVVTLDGTVDFNSDITETVVNDFSDNIIVSAGGTLTVDLSQGTVVLGGITTSVATWDFTNVTALNSKATTATLVINAGVGYTYGDAVNVNGGPIAGGVRWVGGNPPPASNGEDILTFSIIRDSTGLTRVYCSSSINITADKINAKNYTWIRSYSKQFVFNSSYGVERIEVIQGGNDYSKGSSKIVIEGTQNPVVEGIFYPVITGVGTIRDVIIFNTGAGYYPVFSTTTASEVVVERSNFWILFRPLMVLVYLQYLLVTIIS